MLNLVLVEDEIHTANLIRDAISWQDYGIGKCEVFYDGLSAYEYIIQNPVDIVITDIKMPIMDGMTLIEKCRETKTDIKFIIITGHREFQYAYKAIKYNVFDYVLKPIQLSTITEILKKAVKETNKDDALDSIPFQDSALSRDIRSVFANLFYNASTLPTAAHEEFAQENIPEHILNNPCVLINLSFLNFDDFIVNHWKYTTGQFKNAVMKITSLETDYVYFVTLNFWFDELFILAIAKKDAISLDENISKCMEHIKKNFKDIFTLDAKYHIISKSSSMKQLLMSVENDKKETDNESDIIEKCKAYIYENLHKQITLTDVAEHVFLNPIYLSSYFKKKTGENFSVYTRNIRIERAKQLLKKDDFSISQICESIGFSSESYFYKLFKQVTGVTPQQYREQYVEEVKDK